MATPRVVILGGGFGGLYAARALRRADVAVTLVDRANHHLFQPLLYQVATGALSPQHIAVALRRILRKQKNVEVIMGEALAVDRARREVKLRDGGVAPYDFLVVATGATHSYFGHPEWERDAPGLKSLDDATEIRRRILLAYEEAEREGDPARRDSLLTFAVVGGGPTGVELAGALTEIARQALAKDFHHIDPASAKVLLLEAGDRVLPAFPPELSGKAQRKLEEMGVDVRLRTLVTGISPDGVTVKTEAGSDHLAARTVLWAAGVQASPLGRSLGVPVDRAGRALVERDLSVPGSPEVFVIGDAAAVRGVPGLAPAAIQGGRFVARQIERSIRGQPREAFHYVDKGSLATIGRAAAVADIRGLKFSGFIAWVVWLVVHVLTLIGFRNRFAVIGEWAYVYLRNDRGARLITGRDVVQRLDLRAPLPAADGVAQRIQPQPARELSP